MINVEKIGDRIVVKFPYNKDYVQKIDIRTGSDIRPKWKDIRTSHIQPKSEGYANQFGYNLLSEMKMGRGSAFGTDSLASLDINRNDFSSPNLRNDGAAFKKKTL